MNPFRVRNDRGLERDSNRRQRKANRHTTKRLLKGLNGLVEHEFDFERREKVSAKASLEAMTFEANKRKAREKRLQTVYASAGIDDGYDWSVIDDAMSDSHGDPYSIPDNWDDKPVPELERLELGYWDDINDVPWYRPRNAYEYLLPDMPELPIDKGNRGAPMVNNIDTWLDRQVGRHYHEVYAEAKNMAGNHWWVVRDALLRQCTTSGREWRRFRVDSEGVLRHNLPPKKRYQRPVIISEQVKTWLAGRKIVVCGAHLFWYVPNEMTAFVKETILSGVWVSWKPREFAKSFSSFRQDRELNAVEMEFFIRLDDRTQADLLQH